MPRRKKGEKIDGWINLYKPSGIGSTQALSKARRFLNAQKAGHAGTLDPLASGILPIALGEATKLIPYAQDTLKTYIFTVHWGIQRTTDDLEGDVIKTSDERPSLEDINAILPEFLGEITQVPPNYSAIKIDGQRAYDLARQGENPDIQPRDVFIQSLTIEPEGSDDSSDTTRFHCVCGKGTYIRSLARDMGLKLGCFGYIQHLERISVGNFTKETAISLDFLENLSDKTPREEAVLPLQAMLADIPALPLTQEETAKLKHGQRLSFIAKPDMDRLNKASIINEGEALATFEGRPVAMVMRQGPEIAALRVLNV